MDSILPLSILLFDFGESSRKSSIAFTTKKAVLRFAEWTSTIVIAFFITKKLKQC